LQKDAMAEMASIMNKQMDPCADFYEFACGNWGRLYPAYKKVSTGIFEQLGESRDRNVKHMLHNENEQLDTEEDKHVRSFYKSCKRVTDIDETYRSKLKEIIAMFGAMPAIEGRNWRESEFDWIATIGNIAHTLRQTIILGAQFDADLVNRNVNKVYVFGQKFPLEVRGMYVNKVTEIYRTSYRNYMTNELNKYLNFTKDEAFFMANELLDFEVELAKGLSSDDEILDFQKNAKLLTITQMQRLYGPTVDIERLVKITLGKDIVEAYDLHPQYIYNLYEVIQRTPKRIVANYIFYRLTEAFMLKVEDTKAEREATCLLMTRKYFAKNMDNMFYRRHISADIVADVKLMWSELQETFKLTLQSSQAMSWINAHTRQLAIKKLNAMKLQVNSYADEDLSLCFKNIHLSKHDYIENLLRIFKAAANASREKINPCARIPEYSEMLSFAPIYQLQENIIKVPVSMLQPYYLWSNNITNAIKFGSLATLIAHELIHGFDSSGRKFDAQGNLVDWWDKQSGVTFEQRQQCFKEQYSKYWYNGRMLPESNDQSENIADNGAVRIAFKAYLRMLNDQKKMLPTLNFSDLQLFFISFAQVRCNDVHSGARSLQVVVDQHVPGKFRVNGPLENFNEFSKAFLCALGTPMNPEVKCQIY
ncbi:hypothetical protein KR215_001752, partial [Drosophila sulfurigaster]